MKNRSNILINTSIASISIFISFLIMEISLRFFDEIPIFDFTNFVEERTSLLRVNTFAQYDARLGWKAASNIESRGTDHAGNFQTFTTDEYGNRMPSPEIRPLPLRSILAVGDSFTVGSEVSDDESWPARLEAMLDEPIVNASAGGWGTDQIILSAETMMEIADPQIVIVSFFWQDLFRSEYRTYAGGNKPYFLINDGVLVHRNVTVPPFSAGMNEVGALRSVFGHSYLIAWLAQRFGYEAWLASHDRMYVRASPENGGVEISCLLLKRLKEKIDASGRMLVFMVQYASNDFDGDAAEARGQELVNCGRKLGIETVDTWPPMKEVYVRDRQEFDELFVLQADKKSRGHMSASGNAFIAQLLKDRVAEQMKNEQ